MPGNACGTRVSHVLRRAPRYPKTTLKSPGLPPKTRTGPVSARRARVAYRWLPDRLSSLRTLIAATRWLAPWWGRCLPALTVGTHLGGCPARASRRRAASPRAWRHCSTDPVPLPGPARIEGSPRLRGRCLPHRRIFGLGVSAHERKPSPVAIPKTQRGLGDPPPRASPDCFDKTTDRPYFPSVAFLTAASFASAFFAIASSKPAS
jgi:hypothetical protein